MGTVVGKNIMANLKSARSVQTISEVGYHRCDPGLYLQVSKGFTKSWLFRFKSPVTHKQREMGLGSLVLVSLAQARDIAIECRRQLLIGKDPLEERKKTTSLILSQQARMITFKDAAEQCIASKRPEWKSVKHAQQWTNTLASYAYPVFGNMLISEIDTDLILKAIEPKITPDVFSVLSVESSVASRNSFGGTSPAQIKGQIKKWKKRLF